MCLQNICNIKANFIYNYAPGLEIYILAWLHIYLCTIINIYHTQISLIFQASSGKELNKYIPSTLLYSLNFLYLATSFETLKLH